jgi:hypothetical protein
MPLNRKSITVAKEEALTADATEYVLYPPTITLRHWRRTLSSTCTTVIAYLITGVWKEN